MHAYLYRRELQHVRCLCPRQEVMVDESLRPGLKEAMCVRRSEGSTKVAWGAGSRKVYGRMAPGQWLAWRRSRCLAAIINAGLTQSEPSVPSCKFEPTRSRVSLTRGAQDRTCTLHVMHRGEGGGSCEEETVDLAGSRGGGRVKQRP